ncbi:MAG TPA: 3'-5' exonuclease [bacterium]|nr:3'-5' exonuclease [bacterium]
MNFTAFDFETANYKRYSACSIGLVKIANNRIIKKQSVLIRPPEKWFKFTYIHGITWDDVENEPDFSGVWPKIKPFFDNIDFAVAHNINFDAGVLNACCGYYQIPVPEIQFKCSLQLSRKAWNLDSYSLNNICSHFSIPLNHHNALSDAEACAELTKRLIAPENNNITT